MTEEQATFTRWTIWVLGFLLSAGWVYDGIVAPYVAPEYYYVVEDPSGVFPKWADACAGAQPYDAAALDSAPPGARFFSPWYTATIAVGDQPPAEAVTCIEKKPLNYYQGVLGPVVALAVCAFLSTRIRSSRRSPGEIDHSAPSG